MFKEEQRCLNSRKQTHKDWDVKFKTECSILWFISNFKIAEISEQILE